MDEPHIHPTALIEPGVQLGARTAVWDSVHIRGPASIGHDCIVGEKTYIAYDVRIGNLVKINAQVYICAGVSIADRVMISAGVIFTNDRYPRAFDPDTGELASSEPNDDTLCTTVGEGTTIGAGARIGPGLTIGSYAMIGMGAVVTSDVPGHGLVYGNPARLRGYVCRCGTPLTDAVQRAATLGCSRCGRRFSLHHHGDAWHLDGGDTA